MRSNTVKLSYMPRYITLPTNLASHYSILDAYIQGYQQIKAKNAGFREKKRKNGEIAVEF